MSSLKPRYLQQCSFKVILQLGLFEAAYPIPLLVGVLLASIGGIAQGGRFQEQDDDFLVSILALLVTALY